MNSLYKFLSNYIKCPICDDYLFTQLLITFDAYTKNGARFDLTLPYIRDIENKINFKYVKYRDDDDRKYDPYFDRASSGVVVSKNSGFIFDSNDFSPRFYSAYCACQDHPHYYIETKETATNLEVKILREEMVIKNYRIVNDFFLGQTKILLIDDSQKIIININPFYDLKTRSARDIIEKIESLLVLY
jgi:hypothetical protein